MDISVRIAGEAGQGLLIAGELLVGAFASMGLDVLSAKSYMSRIRGGLNWYDIRIADHDIFAGKEKTDLLVCLSTDALEILRDDVEDGGLILHEGGTEGVIGIDFAQIAQQVAGTKIMANTVAAGAVFAILGYDIEDLCRYIEKKFEKAGREIIDRNIACARYGAERALQHGVNLKGPPPGKAPTKVMSGAQACALSSCRAGVKFATAYPMTPGTATFSHLAAYADEYNLVVEQAEDEIAAVNMVCGAVYAGAAAMTMTSGGGFSLMVEGVSLAGMMELPIFILLAQRPGPATGLPTRTAQQDLKFAVSAGHGEFPRAIYAPGTVEQCYTLTRHALQTAHKYQSPVILLTDQYLQDMETNFDPGENVPGFIDRCVIYGEADYRRYALSDSGISPRAIPGGEGFVVSDSDEHTDAGYITEDLDVRIAQQDKRMRKLTGMKSEAIGPEFYGPADADTLLITWGSTYGPSREAVDALNAAGGSAAMLHFVQVCPLNVEAASTHIANRMRVISVEGNQTGQFASMLREAGIDQPMELLTRYDGLPFTADYIMRGLKS